MMNLVRIGAAALAISALLSTAASAGDLFAAFDGKCLKMHGDPKAVIASADAAGWTKLDSKASKDNAFFKLDHYEARASLTTGISLIAGDGAVSLAGKDRRARTCMVAGESDVDEWGKLLSALGMEPVSITPVGAKGPTQALFLFRNDALGYSRLPSADMAELGKGEGSARPPFAMVAATIDGLNYQFIYFWIER